MGSYWVFCRDIWFYMCRLDAGLLSPTLTAVKTRFGCLARILGWRSYLWFALIPASQIVGIPTRALLTLETLYLVVSMFL